MGAVVTAGGRIFTIYDESVVGIYKKVPQKWRLVARDAFNGVLLWKVPLRKWQPEFGTGDAARWGIHHTMPRRLVTDGDRVYVTLEFLDSAVSVLDAATGETITEALPGTKGADEILVLDGVLVAKTTKKRSVAATARIGTVFRDNGLVAVDVKTGRELWRKDGVCVLPYALSAADGRIVYHNMEELVCLDARTGREAWRVPNPTGPTVGGVSNLVVNGGVVLFHGHGQGTKPATGGGSKGKGKKKRPRSRTYLSAFSLEDGSELWRKNGSGGRAQACTQPADVFVANGVVWYGSSLSGLDLKTGEVRKTLKIGKLITPGHHARCHRSKATVRYLIWPKRGAEFAAIDGGDHMRADWLRAPCFTGPTPANGLFYAPTDQCFCYPGVKVGGYLAMSAERHDDLEPSGADALERGPAYGASTRGAPSPDDWPMHRRDVLRSGGTKMTVPTRTPKLWEKELACRGTQPVVVGNRLWIAERDAHRLQCLDAATGRDVWSFTAGGRIDSAPTYHEGTLIFGARDGWVYCLRASDGKLAWRRPTGGSSRSSRSNRSGPFTGACSSRRESPTSPRGGRPSSTAASWSTASTPPRARSATITASRARGRTSTRTRPGPSPWRGRSRTCS